MQNFNPSAKNSNPLKNKRETITQLAHRHLKDEKHTTTDEELRNAVWELSGDVHTDEENLFEIDNTTIIPPLPFEDNNNEDKDNNTGKNNTSVPNPYDILR